MRPRQAAFSTPPENPVDRYRRIVQARKRSSRRRGAAARRQKIQSWVIMLLRRRSSKVDVLEELPLFSGLGRRYLDLIARHADQVKLDAGSVLARQGGLAREFVLVVEGSARVEKDGKTIVRLGAGDFFGEISLIDGKPQTATVIASTPMVVMVVEARSFTYLLGAVPELERRLLGALCERLREAEVAWPRSITPGDHHPAVRPPRPIAA